MSLIRNSMPTLLIAGVTYAAAPAYYRDIPTDLLREARITEETAVAAARSAVPKGTVSAIELERENGTLLYAIDIKIPGHHEVEELRVEALKGHLLSRIHESATVERREAVAERKSPD